MKNGHSRWYLTVAVVDHAQQRCDTVIDWRLNGGFVPHELIVTDLGEEPYNQLLMLHAFVELAWCKRNGVSREAVEAFNRDWQAHDGIAEPGDDPKAPYHEGHQLALAVEHLVALGLRVSWKDYNDALRKDPV